MHFCLSVEAAVEDADFAEEAAVVAADSVECFVVQE